MAEEVIMAIAQYVSEDAIAAYATIYDAYTAIGGYLALATSSYAMPAQLRATHADTAAL